MPILGVIASGISGNLTPVFDPSAYDAIASVTLASTTTTVIFAGIPNTYKHLELRYFARHSGSGQTYARVSVNDDFSSSNYYAHDLFGTGSGTTTGSYYGGQTGFPIQKIPSGTSIFGAGILSILDYANTNKNKTARNLGGQDSNGSGEIDFVSSFWNNTAAITSLSITPVANSWTTYSSFALYGVK
jgi:hypothetical protein